MPDIHLTNSQVGIIGDNVHVKGDIHITTYQHLPTRPVDDATLAVAHARLAELPLDAIPEPASLPLGSRMPLNINPHFVGRADHLKQLAAALKGGQTTAIGQIAAATGLGGIGKTQLASEFVHRYGRYFAGGVFWLNFGEPVSILVEIATCGGPGMLNLCPDFNNLPLNDQVALVLSAWSNPLPRLLIFDNCEDETLLADWRPTSGGSRVLVTSRRGEWSATLGIQTLPLDVLSRTESVALLRKHRPDLSDGDATAIAAELGDLPLALHLAGSFLVTYRHAIAPDEYLIQLRHPALLEHPSLQGRGAAHSPTAHEQHVARTFALSYERLNPADMTDALALALLARAAYFAPGVPIPRDLLRATLTLPADDPSSKLQAEDVLTRLVTMGLLEVGSENQITLHRLLVVFARGVTNNEEAQAAVEKTLWIEAYRLNGTGFPALLRAWQPHLYAIADTVKNREDSRAVGLCNVLGYHLKMIGNYSEAQLYYERSLAIREKTLGPNHPEVASSLNDLGTLRRVMGDLIGARSYLERALAIRERILGPNHPHTASSLNKLGGLLNSVGDLVGAQSYFKRALAIWEKNLGTDHPDTARSLNNLGMLLKAMNDLSSARAYFERALTIREKTLGPEHPDTAQSLNNLGYLLQAVGDLSEAHSYYARALTIREKILGAEHPDTAQSLNNLALLYDDEGKLEEAIRLMRRALAVREAKLGPDHPDTQSSQHNLAVIEAKLQK